MPNKNTPLKLKFFIHPLYWFTWLGIGMLYLTTKLPYKGMLRLGTTLGWVTYILMPQRRRITRTNIRLAFPDYDNKQVRQLVRQSFYSASIAIFESAWAWWASEDKIRPLNHIERNEHIDAALKLGKGVILLGGHYTTLEMSGRLLAFYHDVYPTYKRAHNKLFEAILQRRRRSFNKGLVRSTDMRTTIRLLKQGEIIWYAPDQDFGRERSVFAPFMGVQTATLTMTSRLAARTGAPIVPFYSERLAGDQGYKIHFGPMLTNFPSGDVVKDATAINAAIEDNVRRVPEQYLWGHRRFKTRPPGEPQIYKPRRGKIFRRYTLALVLTAVPVLLFTMWTAFKHRQFGYFKERLGFGRTPNVDLHVHAASIGEVNAVAPLVKQIQVEFPNKSIMLTVNTPSGLQTAQKQFANSIICRYMPLDWHWVIYRFLDRVKPSCVLIMETEIWPNFFEYCQYRGIRHLIINARLSEKTLRAPKFLFHCLCQSIRESTAVLARSQQDADRFLSFSARPDNVKVLGNMKFASAQTQAPSPVNLGRPYVLLASSRDDEEKQLVETWLSLETDRPLLVIVPRHIHRLNNILSDLQDLTKDIAIRSREDRIDDTTRIYIADTFGELGGFIAGSSFVIMGGSFEPFGGQNIIEVARAGKAVVFGPHMQNFQMESQLFLENHAAIQVNNQSELKTVLVDLLSHPDRVAQLGQNGTQLIERHAHVIDDYMAELQKLCELH